MDKKYNLTRRFTGAFVLAAFCMTTITKADETLGGKKAKLPFIIYTEKESSRNHYAISGWMGNSKDIRLDDGWTNNPHSGKSCLRCEYRQSDDWAGIVWQDPANDWGELPGGWDLSGAKKLTFWARGDKGGEVVSFKFGLLGADKKFSDSSSGAINEVKLTPSWTEYSIDLAGKDLTDLKTGFAWSVAGQGSAVVFYLDDICYQ